MYLYLYFLIFILFSFHNFYNDLSLLAWYSWRLFATMRYCRWLCVKLCFFVLFFMVCLGERQNLWCSIIEHKGIQHCFHSFCVYWIKVLKDGSCLCFVFWFPPPPPSLSELLKIFTIIFTFIIVVIIITNTCIIINIPSTLGVIIISDIVFAVVIIMIDFNTTPYQIIIITLPSPSSPSTIVGHYHLSVMTYHFTSTITTIVTIITIHYRQPLPFISHHLSLCFHHH